MEYLDKLDIEENQEMHLDPLVLLMVTLIYGTFDLQKLDSLPDQKFLTLLRYLYMALLDLNKIRPNDLNKSLVNRVTSQLTLGRDACSYLPLIY